MNRLRLYVLILALALVLPAAQPVRATVAPAPDMAAIDRYVAEQLRTLRIPGASLGIVHGDRIVHLRGFGRADSTGRAMTPETPSLIGSLTKSFTAVAIMQLVEAGKVELDAPVQRYLPWFRVADPEASARITVRHLLTHSSGLPTGDDTPIVSREDTAADAIERQVRAMASVELAHPVGATAEYSSTGYNVLGLIVETVSGRSYENYIQEHIFAPLTMEQSFTSPEAARPKGLAEGHQYWFGQPRPARLPYPRGMLPAGFLVSSVEDMSRYVLAHLNGGKVGEARILSPEGIAELHRPAVSAGDGVSIGMDWGVADMDGVRVLQHDGNTLNYRSTVWLLPETGYGFVLLMNASNALQQSATRGLGHGVAMLLMSQQPQAVSWNRASDVVIAAILAIAGLQAVGMARSIRTLRRWREAPPTPAFWRHILLPLAGNALVALLFLMVAPTLLGTSLGCLAFQIPDMGYTLIIAGSLSLGWSLLRTVLALRLVSQPAPARGRTALLHS